MHPDREEITRMLAPLACSVAQQRRTWTAAIRTISNGWTNESDPVKGINVAPID